LENLELFLSFLSLLSDDLLIFGQIKVVQFTEVTFLSFLIRIKFWASHEVFQLFPMSLIESFFLE
jgi:hypothetical protein